MRALVTGGAGFIGSAIARHLVERGDQVVVLDNLLTGVRENVPERATFVHGDLREIADIERACEGIDFVFHQGALRSVPRSVDQPELSLQCNVVGTMNLLLAAERARVRRVVYASSSSVYGDSGGVNREDMASNPMSPYAVSKLAGEHYCRVWSRLGRLSTVSLRYFNVFGPGQRPESKYSTVFPAFISSLASGHPPELHWDGEQSRDFTYIDDVVRANLLAAEADDRVDGEVINIGGGEPKTVNEVLHSVADAMGCWIEPVKLPKREGDVRRTNADISKAGTLLDWKPEMGWKDAVEATVEWFHGSRR